MREITILFGVSPQLFHIRTPSDILRNRELLEANGLELPLS